MKLITFLLPLFSSLGSVCRVSQSMHAAVRKGYEQKHRRGETVHEKQIVIFISNCAPNDDWIWWHRIQNRNFRTQIRIFKNIKSYSLVKKDQKSDICQMLVPSRKKQRTTNLGTESLCNPGSVSPEALSGEQMWTFPGPLHRFYFHYISTICVSLILRTSSALPQ